VDGEAEVGVIIKVDANEWSKSIKQWAISAEMLVL
jgi:hypothetical protein